MTYRTCRAALLGLMSLAVAVQVRATPIVVTPTVQYSQDGVHFKSLSLIESPLTAARYYRHKKDSGYPAFGRAAKTASVAAYWDTTDDTLSLLFISGGGAGDRGHGTVSVTGLPRAGRLTLTDDSGEFTYSPRRGSVAGAFNYGGSNDGFVLGNLEGTSFTAKLKLTPQSHIDALRLADGDPASTGDFLKLNLHKPLYLRVAGTTGSTGTGASGTGVGAAVPEPSGFGLVAIALSPVLLRRRRTASRIA